MSYVAGTNLTFGIPLTNASGASIDAVSVDYRVVDGEGVQLQPWGALSGYVAGSDATVTTLAGWNTLAVGTPKAVREIELRATLADASKQMASFIYFIEAETGSLVRGVNSMVTMGGAELLASEIPGMTNWISATRENKVTSLIEAYRRLGKLRFTTLDNFYYDQTGPLRRSNATSLTDLSASEVLALDSKMALAVSLAQVSEADIVMNGETAESKRLDGLILDTIGEVKQMYRSGKPLQLPVSRRTLGYISAYMSLGSKVIGRT